jgi:hypothetical protein
MPIRNLSIALSIALLTASAHGTTYFPQQFTARYAVASNGHEMGVMTRTVTHTGGKEFLFRSEIKATHGLYALLRVKVLETSRWRLQGSTVQPLDYEFRLTGPRKRESHARFDWNRNVIGVLHKQKSSELPATAGMLDKLLYQLVLMRDLADGNPLEYTVIDGTKIKHYPIERLGEETLTTPLGPLQTVKLHYQKPGSKRSTTLWCAASLDYLPVKLDHIEDEDERTSALILSVTGLSGGR